MKRCDRRRRDASPPVASSVARRRLRSSAPGQATGECRIAHRDAAGVAGSRARHAAGGAAGRVQTLDHGALGSEHLAAGQRVQPAQREKGIEGAVAGRAIERGQRQFQRLEPFGGLVEQRIHALGRVAIEHRDGVLQRALGQLQLALQLRHRFLRRRHEFGTQIADLLVTAEVLDVRDQVHAPLWLLEAVVTDAPVVAVLVHEALTLGVDQDPQVSDDGG